MYLLRALQCFVGLHAQGRYCAYCGKLLDRRVQRTFRVRSIHQAGLDLLVTAVDEAHAKALVGGGWHPENLVATEILEVTQRNPS